MDWISVDDELPPTGFAPDFASSQMVIVWTDACSEPEDVMFAYYHDDGKWRGADLSKAETVTHWMQVTMPKAG